jgi:hypothetical protein
MTNEELLREINSLPPEGQRLVESFLAFVRQRYTPSVVTSGSTFLQDEKFIGMWRDRDELTDSSAWVRGLRESEWGQ